MGTSSPYEYEYSIAGPDGRALTGLGTMSPERIRQALSVDGFAWLGDCHMVRRRKAGLWEPCDD